MLISDTKEKRRLFLFRYNMRLISYVQSTYLDFICCKPQSPIPFIHTSMFSNHIPSTETPQYSSHPSCPIYKETYHTPRSIVPFLNKPLCQPHQIANFPPLRCTYHKALLCIPTRTNKEYQSCLDACGNPGMQL